MPHVTGTHRSASAGVSQAIGHGAVLRQPAARPQRHKLGGTTTCRSEWRKDRVRCAGALGLVSALPKALVSKAFSLPIRLFHLDNYIKSAQLSGLQSCVVTARRRPAAARMLQVSRRTARGAWRETRRVARGARGARPRGEARAREEAARQAPAMGLHSILKKIKLKEKEMKLLLVRRAACQRHWGVATALACTAPMLPCICGRAHALACAISGGTGQCGQDHNREEIQRRGHQHHQPHAGFSDPNHGVRVRPVRPRLCGAHEPSPLQTPPIPCCCFPIQSSRCPRRACS